MGVGLQPNLVYSPHPLVASADRRLIYAPFEAGETIAAYLDRAGIRLGSKPVVLYVNDRFIPRSEWPLTIPRQGDLITIRALVRDGGGGDGGGSDPVRTVLTIAVMIYAPYLAGPAGLGFQVGTLAYSAATAAIAIGGMLVVNALVPPPRPQLSQAARRLDSPSPTYSLSGGSNRARPYEPMPLVLGQYRVFPDLGAREYTEFVGDDQYLYQVFNFGLSDVVLSDFRIGATPIGNFADVEIEESGADGKLTLFPANVDTTSGGALTYAAGWIARTSSTNATALAVDIAGSLYRATQNGIEAHSVTVEMEYRKVGDPDWLPFEGAVSAVTLTSDSRKPLRRTWRKTVAKAQYEVRLRRTTADDTDAQAVSDLSWSQLRTYQPDEADYTGQKRVAVRIKASGQLQGQIAECNALASARCPVWNGSSWVTQATGNPAWWYLWLARGKTLNGRRVFGACLSDSRLDIEGLKEFGAFCDSKSLTFNGVFDGVMSCAEMLASVARCGRGAPSWATGKYGVIWDAPHQPVVAVFGMGNIKRNSFKVEYTTEKLADEVVLKFINPNLVGGSGNWQMDKVRAKAPGVTNPERPAEMELFGCTDVDMAGREANLLAAAQEYLVRTISWETDFEGLPVQRGNVAILSHDLTQWGYSGRIVAGTGSSLALDRKVPFTVGQSHYIGITFPNGYYDIFAVTYQAGESDTIALAEPWPTQDDLGNPLYTPSADPNHPPCDYKFVFDPKATPGKKVKITGIKPLTEHYVRITATDEEADYYAQEYNSYTYVTPATYGGALPAISNLQASETLVRAGAVWNVQLTITWDVTGPYGGAVVRAGVNGEPLTEKGRTLQRRYDIMVPDTGAVNIEVTAFDPRGRWSDAGKAAVSHAIAGKTLPPPDISWFLLDGRRLSWSKLSKDAVPDLAGYAIRFHYGINRDFDTANPLHDGLLTESPYDMVSLPDKQVTLLIKSMDTFGNPSLNPGVIITDFGDALQANVVEEFDLKALGWPGTVTGGAVDGNGDLAATETSLFYRAAAPEVFFKLYDSVNFFDDILYAQMVYESAWVQPSKAAVGSVMALPRALAGDGIAIEYRPVGPGRFYADVDSELYYAGADSDAFYDPLPDYTGWPGSIVVGNQPYQFRATTGNRSTQGKISGLTPTIDVPDIEERLDDVVLASSGTRLPIAKTYTVIKNVNLTLQDDGGTATRVRMLDKNPSLGPLVQADANGAPTTAKVDATVQGY